MSPAGSFLLSWAVAAAAASTSLADTPVGKVVELLDGLLQDVKDEGVHEAQTYDDFACFCRTTTDTKSQDIKHSQDVIETKSSTIESKTATTNDKRKELMTRQKRHEEMNMELSQVEANFAKTKSEYEAKAADLSKAISS